MKKLLLAICLIFLLGFSVTALEIDKITPTNDFIIYSADPQKVAEALNTDTHTLENKVAEHNIKFLAVTEDNSKQIQLTENKTDFSNSVKNLSNLSDGSIKSLLPDITGLKNIKGKILLKNEQKYVKINLKNQNDDYILTQYFTIENSKLYTLSFYTKSGVSTDYIEKTFQTDGKISDDIEIPKTPVSFKIIVILGTVFFFAACIFLIYSILKDIIKSRK